MVFLEVRAVIDNVFFLLFHYRAHLVLIMEDAENGEMMEHRFKCDNANTMADEGAYPEARFFIAIGDDDDD